MTISVASRIKVSIVILFLLSVDFITKIYATKLLPLYTEGTLNLTHFSDELSFLLVRHYKSMEMLGSSHNLGLILMGFLALYFVFGAYNFPKTYQRYAFAVYLGGYGNILEIAYHDYATDFLYFEPLNKLVNNIYIFNFADVVITISIAIFVIGLTLEYIGKIIKYFKANKYIESSDQ